MTIKEMLDALQVIGGDKARNLVEEKRDEATEQIVMSWPTRLDTARAASLGFAKDGSLEQTLREYLEDYGPSSSK